MDRIEKGEMKIMMQGMKKGSWITEMRQSLPGLVGRLKYLWW